MQYKYPKITAGHLGLKVECPTVNSGFYAELFQNQVSNDFIQIFPQRVPKIGFFLELKQLELSDFAEKFDYFIESMRAELSHAYSETLSKSNAQQIRILNLLRLHLRYGLCEDILKTDYSSLFVGEQLL